MLTSYHVTRMRDVCVSVCSTYNPSTVPGFFLLLPGCGSLSSGIVLQVRGDIITDRRSLTLWPGVWWSYSSVTLATHSHMRSSQDVNTCLFATNVQSLPSSLPSSRHFPVQNGIMACPT